MVDIRMDDITEPKSLPEPEPPVIPCSTLATMTNGRGRKASRLARIRREAAARRWQNKNQPLQTIQLNRKIFEKVAAEQ